MSILSGACSLPPSDDNDVPLIGAELQNPVTLDGEISSSEEWSDTEYVDMDWGFGIPPGPPFVNSRLWAKNEDAWLYLLYRVE